MAPYTEEGRLAVTKCPIKRVSNVSHTLLLSLKNFASFFRENIAFLEKLTLINKDRSLALLDIACSVRRRNFKRRDTTESYDSCQRRDWDRSFNPCVRSIILLRAWSYAASTLTIAPARTFRRTLGSPSNVPRILHLSASRHSVPFEIGVGPNGNARQLP